jgi:hypothetical protein
MPIFKVVMWTERKIEIDVECGKHDDPESKAIEQANFNEGEELQDRTEITLSDNQYTSAQEDQDEEARYERKFGND